MSGERIPGKVIFETQSTHKMLAALSQASLIHIKGNYDEETFNEAFYDAYLYVAELPHRRVD